MSGVLGMFQRRKRTVDTVYSLNQLAETEMAAQMFEPAEWLWYRLGRLSTSSPRSYERRSKQRDDQELLKLADKIHGHAIARIGESLAAIEPAMGGDRKSDQWDSGGPLVSRKQAASDAGLSERIAKQALRMANVPGESREADVT